MYSAFGVDHGYEEVEKGLFGSAGKHAAKGLPKIFGRSSGGARKKVVGGARKGPATTNEPTYAAIAARRGVNQGGARRAV